MTRAEIIAAYKIDTNPDNFGVVGMIRSPGKFEGEMLYAPYFYDLAIDGGADYTLCDEDGTAEYDVFNITPEDVAEFPELAGVLRVECHEDTNGFFFCHTIEE